MSFYKSSGSRARPKSSLDRALEQQSKGRPGRPTASDYYRQYVGIRIGRRQVVYVNGFHRSVIERAAARPESAEMWRTRAVNVCDGGSAFFGAEYDAAARQVSTIRFNGPGWTTTRTDQCSRRAVGAVG